MDDPGGSDLIPKVEPIAANIYRRLPADLKPLVYHMVADE